MGEKQPLSLPAQGRRGSRRSRRRSSRLSSFTRVAALASLATVALALQCHCFSFTSSPVSSLRTRARSAGMMQMQRQGPGPGGPRPPSQQQRDQRGPVGSPRGDYRGPNRGGQRPGGGGGASGPPPMELSKPLQLVRIPRPGRDRDDNNYQGRNGGGGGGGGGGRGGGSWGGPRGGGGGGGGGRTTYNSPSPYPGASQPSRAPRSFDDGGDSDGDGIGEVKRFRRETGSTFDAEAREKAGYAPRSSLQKKDKGRSDGRFEDGKPKRGRTNQPEKRKRSGWGDDDEFDGVGAGGGRRRQKRSRPSYPPVKPAKQVQLDGSTITVADLAAEMESKPAEVIKYLMMQMGIMATITQSIDSATAAKVAQAFGKKVADGSEDVGEDEEDSDSTVLETGTAIDTDPEESLRPRSPVVTIMGHVDHGKTSLLDAIRSAKVASGEAGGITQHIGAYQVTTESGQDITFIDTPGHAAFTEMRTRGADCTDIVVLVVAADDGVKEQTRESIAMAKLAGVPIVVAINKMDKADADPSRVLDELMQYDLLATEFGGDTEVSRISAKAMTGLDDLLEKIMLQSEVLELKSNPDRLATGVVIEAAQSQGMGTVATTLIQRGTLRVGDSFVAGGSWGRVRALINHMGARVTEAGPSVPIQVVGFDGMPDAGDAFIVVEDESQARDLADARRKIIRQTAADELQGNVKGVAAAMLSGIGNEDGRENLELNVLIKADVRGSAEALSTAVANLVSEDDYFVCKAKILQSGVGALSKSDVAIASVSKAYVVCFNTEAGKDSLEDARRDGVEVGFYSVVYEALDHIQHLLDEKRSPTPEGTYVGKATVKAVFNIGKVGNIAGCEVVDGYIKKGAAVRVMRRGRVQHEGTVKTLKNVKTDVDQMVAGTECGIQVSGFEDFEADDYIECFEA